MLASWQACYKLHYIECKLAEEPQIVSQISMLDKREVFHVDIIAQLDLSAIYARYGTRGAQPYAPEILLGLLFYDLRKCTVEPVIGIIKEVLDFRQFSLRSEQAVAGEWCLVCLAFNLKRLHTLLQG